MEEKFEDGEYKLLENVDIDIVVVSEIIVEGERVIVEFMFVGEILLFEL